MAENVHAERAALFCDLSNHEPLHWATPSLCAGWDIRDVVIHLAATATLSLTKFVVELVAAGFSTQRIADKQITHGRQFPAVHALNPLQSATYATASPPQPTITRLIQIVHLPCTYLTPRAAGGSDTPYGVADPSRWTNLSPRVSDDTKFVVGQHKPQLPSAEAILGVSDRCARAAEPIYTTGDHDWFRNTFRR